MPMTFTVAVFSETNLYREMNRDRGIPFVGISRTFNWFLLLDCAFRLNQTDSRVPDAKVRQAIRRRTRPVCLR